MIIYFDGHDNEHRAFWANFKMEEVMYFIDLHSKFVRKFKGFRKDLQDYLLETSLLSDPAPTFYSCALSYLCGEKSLLEEIDKYPDGGWAIIGNLNYNDESVFNYKFLEPETFTEHLKKDYSVVPWREAESGFKFIDDIIVGERAEETIFLSFLAELIKDSDYSCCNLSNEELLKVIPIPHLTTEWISKILGKLQKEEIIGVITYQSNGLNWYRDIFLKHPSNHIRFGMGNRLSA